MSFKSLKDEEEASPPSPQIARLQRLALEAGGIEELERLACGCDADPEASPATGETALSQPSQESPHLQDGTSDAGQPAHPKPAIRRIWDTLFGSDDRSSDEDRKAG